MPQAILGKALSQRGSTSRRLGKRSLCLPWLAPFFWLSETAAERALLIGVLLIVLVVELLNSAIESVVDRIGDDYHKLSGRAKDQGSAAVFLSIFIAILVWSGFLISKLVG